MRLVFNARGRLRDDAKRCESDVFLDWFGNTPEDFQAEYGPYEDASVFLAVVDDRDEVHAAARLIQPGPAGLKTLNDLRRDPWRLDPDGAAAEAGVDPARSWESATFAVKDGVRRRGYAAMEALFYGLAVGSVVNGFTSVVAVIDENVRRVFGSIGLFLHPFPGAATGPYLGSPASTPLYAHTEEILSTQHRVAPDMYRAIMTGVGLEGIRVPHPMRLLLPTRAPSSPQRRVVDVAAHEASREGRRHMDLDAPSESGRSTSRGSGR